MSGSREWDAGTYDRVSGPQFEWGTAVVADLELDGGETVLDAGCGSGRVSELVLERLDPEAGGHLIGVDGSAAMVEQARERLGSGVTLIHSDLLELELPRAGRRRALDRHLPLDPRPRPALESGSRAGSAPAAGSAPSAAARATSPASWRPATRSRPSSRGRRISRTCRRAATSPAPRRRHERLERSGFTDVECWLEPRNTEPEEPREFVGTVCLGVHTDALPAELRDPFIDAVYERWGPGSELDYVRLNVARPPRACGGHLDCPAR